MPLPASALAVGAAAILCALAGFLVAFRQRRVRALVRRLSGRPPARRPGRAQGEDPLHSFMMIAGVMLMAFGVLIFAFTTFYALLTAPAGP